jgi:hypothetical protein
MGINKRKEGHGKKSKKEDVGNQSKTRKRKEKER